MSTGLSWRCPRCGHAARVINRDLTCSSCDVSFSLDPVLTTTPAFEPEGFPASRRRHLRGLEEAEHFWFAPRRQLITHLLRRFVVQPLTTAMELGCGTGSSLSLLDEHALEVVGLDAYGSSLDEAASRTAGATLVQGDVCRVPLDDRQIDLLLALDVAEHVDDRRFFAEAARLARAQALFIVSVPSCAALWSELDEAAGHRRRYSRAVLIHRLQHAGWQVLFTTHYQFLLLPLIWMVRRWPSPAPRRRERSPWPWLGAVLGGINRLEVRLFKRWSLPCGSSVIAVARRAA